MRGDPAREANTWLEKLAEVDGRRAGYLELAADGFIIRDELRGKLADLEEIRQTTKPELENSERRRARVRDLEHDKDILLETYAGMISEALNDLSPEDRHPVYKMLRLTVVAHADGTLEASGVLSAPRLGTTEPI
jgi:hypothetical protein